MKISSADGTFKVNNEIYYRWIENRPQVFELIFAEGGVLYIKE